MNQPYALSDKTVLVTGANRGIGKAICEALIAHNVRKVVATAREVSALKAFAQSAGEKVQCLQLDLTDTESIQAAACNAHDVQVVINNAGVLTATDPFSPEVFASLDYEFDVNVRGLLRVAHSFAPVLKANGGGMLVQINSVASLACYAPLSTYCASKAAAYSLTQGLRHMLAGQGTQVLSVHPGPIATNMAVQAGVAEQAEPPTVVADAIIAAIESGDSHCFPDAIAKEFGQPYADFMAALVKAGYLND
jgi:short-subunit dehydrogenase